MLFLATFFPTWEGGAGVYDFVGVSVETSERKDEHFLTPILCIIIAKNTDSRKPAYVGGFNVCVSLCLFSRNL